MILLTFDRRGRPRGHTDSGDPTRDDIRHTLSYAGRVKPFRWSPEKNQLLAAQRGITFERIVVAISDDGLLEVYQHPNISQYPNQRILVVACDDYVYLVPYVEDEDHLFLKTVIPSRKATRDYLGSPMEGGTL